MTEKQDTLSKQVLYALTTENRDSAAFPMSLLAQVFEAAADRHGFMVAFGMLSNTQNYAHLRLVMEDLPAPVLRKVMNEISTETGASLFIAPAVVHGTCLTSESDTHEQIKKHAILQSACPR